MTTIRVVHKRAAVLPAVMLASALGVVALTAVAPRPGPRDVDWPVNGGRDNIRYSPLAQINRENVSSLQVAWTYDSRDAFTGSEMQSNPIVVDGVLYATTPTLKVVAVDAAARSWHSRCHLPQVDRRNQFVGDD